MKNNTILHIMGMLLICFAVVLLFPIICALIYDEGDAAALIITSAVAALIGLPLWRGFSDEKSIGVKDGYIIITLGWVVISSFSALPFMIHGSIPSFTDAFFEVMSGYTTTGATILKNIELMPHGLLLWRSMTHFIGGMGIVIITLSFIPLLGTGNLQLYRAEGDPGQGVGSQKIAPRIKDTLYWLWIIYIGLNAAEVILLGLGGMSLFDALCHAFGTLATGGYSTKNASLAYYKSAYFDGVVTVFMFLGGLNFLLYYYMMTRKWNSLWKNTEFRFYLGITLFICFMVAFILWNQNYYSSFTEAFRFGAFQVVSILTTTGFITDNYELWPQSAQMLILLSMFIGACNGSTTSGIRIIQWVIVGKFILSSGLRLLQPLKIVPIRINGEKLDAAYQNNALGFFAVNIIVVLLGGCLMTLVSNLNVFSALTAVMATLWNIGPGFGAVGAIENYALISDLGKWVLSFCMLIGRLDIFTVMVLFYPSFWKK
ncbi:potassium transporter TrkG [Deltaproteobacteria bacterium TL4]